MNLPALHHQLYQRIRTAIETGTLEPGERLPSVRALAKEMGVARGTVDQAWALLTGEGYLLARGAAGTVVNPNLQLHSTTRAAPTPLPAQGAQFPDTLWRPGTLMPFQMGVPALDVFPRKLWARLGARYVRGMGIEALDYPPPHGLPGLRAAIAAYLQVARGLSCEAGQVFITSGWRHSLALVAHALLQQGDAAWVESPGYPPTRQLLREAGFTPVPVAVDEHGLNVEQGVAQAAHARLAVVTPANQSPLSVSLALPRRQALLAWASQAGSWVLEDDYDGEFRYCSRPLPALASLDTQGRVLYSGTFSKVLFPGLRVAYLMVPASEVERFERVSRCFFAGAVPAMVQAQVQTFMAEGHFARHIARMRKLYAQRRTATAEALAQGLGTGQRAAPAPGGMHLLLELAPHLDDRRIAQQLLEQGMAVQPLSAWYAGVPAAPGLLIGFTHCSDPADAVRLGQAIRRLTGY
ncbi:MULTISPECIES: PLP-dependent aminotransferase family protein [unclassified Pseudomonas]|uniref:MocR-like pyridoxine biosynthesis transcription factor PdxR n=1 Tax=unclassified Pseudomonas TaxID=196821 RepID=UPI000BC79CD3|nr:MULTISPECIES: PLP-dependent aminotransferase family protein [unclassified Pseudomonas]PVZ11381.1 GntR family transcriptional regulator/MocR family aminotransferase [Pseudomonas sp. URIL14HWK12:I12]PVZ22379.1 GntR family transcriptional regulator/MocR family aminotransferase [Pseudomonas sp. URIL14HWK12:I10]PVZ31497.1 GntR family transcriptional regulator/MocR family aminotransferase [Pseudomonas sp. URIL14HWK12:I11]SNZ16450.1 GntR family transcriptional regulator / MocR family aminotransfera